MNSGPATLTIKKGAWDMVRVDQDGLHVNGRYVEDGTASAQELFDALRELIRCVEDFKFKPRRGHAVR